MVINRIIVMRGCPAPEQLHTAVRSRRDRATIAGGETPGGGGRMAIRPPGLLEPGLLSPRWGSG